MNQIARRSFLTSALIAIFGGISETVRAGVVFHTETKKVAKSTPTLVVHHEITTRTGYPIRDGWWSHSDPDIHHHLVHGHGVRDSMAGWSYAEMESFHTDLHEGSRRSFIQIQTQTKPAVAAPKPVENAVFVKHEEHQKAHQQPVNQQTLLQQQLQQTNQTQTQKPKFNLFPFMQKTRTKICDKNGCRWE